MPGESARINGRKGGRPKGSKDPHTLAKQLAREQFTKYVMEHLPAMLPAQVAAAKGIQHFVLRQKDGKFKKVESAEAAVAALNDPEAVYDFWTRDPSTHAFGYLVDQALDRPAQPQRVTGADDGPVEHVFKWQK